MKMHLYPTIFIAEGKGVPTEKVVEGRLIPARPMQEKHTDLPFTIPSNYHGATSASSVPAVSATSPTEVAKLK